MPRGGHRVGSGEKPAAKRTRFGAAPSAGAADPAAVPMPAGLTPRGAELWAELAPLATFAGTLTSQTVRAFSVLLECLEVLEAMQGRIRREGVIVEFEGKLGPEQRAHPLLTQVRGMVQRVDALLARFALAPFGKPVAATAAGEGPKPANPWAAYGVGTVIKGGRA